MTANELRRRFPNASAAFIRHNSTDDSGLRPNDQKPDEGSALVRRVSRKEKGGPRPAFRYRIRFTVYAVHPADWDGYNIKELQDMLVAATVLHGDEWDVLQGEVVSEKVHQKEEERTEIVIGPA